MYAVMDSVDRHLSERGDSASDRPFSARGLRRHQALTMTGYRLARRTGTAGSAACCCVTTLLVAAPMFDVGVMARGKDSTAYANVRSREVRVARPIELASQPQCATPTCIPRLDSYAEWLRWAYLVQADSGADRPTDAPATTRPLCRTQARPGSASRSDNSTWPVGGIRLGVSNERHDARALRSRGAPGA